MIRALVRLLAAPFALVLATASCGDDSFHVNRAGDFPKTGGARVSVFGVYRDGRLAPEAWDVFRPHLAPLFGPVSCEPGYPDILTTSGNPALQAADDFTRENGVTDELLALLAPMAKGDLVLLVTMTGRPGVKPESDPGPNAGPATLRTGGRHGGPGPAQTKKPVPDASSFEAVGVVFSVKAKHSVAAVRLDYSGASLDEAIQAFMTRLGDELPHAACAGWKPDVHLDPADIHRLAAD